VRPTTWIVGVALAGACGGSSDPPGDPPRGPRMAQFADGTQASRVEFDYATTDFKGGGLAVVDLDGDGRPDIMAGSRLGGLSLFHNLGSLRFERVIPARSGLDDALKVAAIAAVDLDKAMAIATWSGQRTSPTMANQAMARSSGPRPFRAPGRPSTSCQWTSMAGSWICSSATTTSTSVSARSAGCT
jgi:hypothetical protein